MGTGTYEFLSEEQSRHESPSWGQRMRETKERVARILPKVSQIPTLLAAIFAYDMFVLKMCTKPRHPSLEGEMYPPIVLETSHEVYEQ
jgi:hypothetical protein